MMASFLRHMTADQEKPGLTMVKTLHFQTIKANSFQAERRDGCEKA